MVNVGPSMFFTRQTLARIFNRFETLEMTEKNN